MTVGTDWFTGSVIQWKRRIVRDADGRPVHDDNGNDMYSTDVVTLTGVVINPRIDGRLEVTDRQQRLRQELDLYCDDPEADIAATDRFLIDGKEWEVDSPIARYRGSFMNNDHSSCILARQTG